MSEDIRSWIFRQGSNSTLVAAEAMVEVLMANSSDIYKEGKVDSEPKAGDCDDDKEVGMIGSRSVEESRVRLTSDRGEGLSTYETVASLICVIAGTGTLASTLIQVMACLVFIKSMKEVALLSIIGAGATIGVVMITVGISADMIRHRAEVTLRATHQLIDWPKLPHLARHNVICAMRYQRSWSKALWFALVACFVLYFIIAVAGYTAFGSETVDPVLKNLLQGLYISKVSQPCTRIHETTIPEASLFTDDDRLRSWAHCLRSSLLWGCGGSPRSAGDMSARVCHAILFYHRSGGLKNASLLSKIWAWFIFVVGLVALVMGTYYDATKHVIDGIRYKWERRMVSSPYRSTSGVHDMLHRVFTIWK
ncbi:hypothetical protein BGX34_005669 [Mortierella sp. NVP85]|nr:hypothetical protein BGX34_005669 [Mortierella sp. NVP85]